MVKKEGDELQKFVKEKIAKIHELAPMNTELQKWVEEKDAEKKKDFIGIHKKITGKCTLCQENPAQYRCIKCKKAVCASHYWILFGLCKTCASDETIKRWEQKNLGIDIIK